jgi:hypothetical protein
MINLFMATLLAIIVTLRVLQVIAVVIGILAGIAMVFGQEELAPIEAWADDASATLGQVASDLDKPISDALKGLNDVADVVAVGMPWAALAKSLTVSGYYPQVTRDKGGLTVGMSMSMIPDLTWIPPVNDTVNTALDGLPGKKTTGGSATLNPGQRWGLPVEDGKFSRLCEYAAQMVPDLIEWALTAMITGKANASPPSWLSWLNGILGKVIGALPGVFCDENQIAGGLGQSAVQQQAQQACQAKQEQFNDCENAEGLNNGAFDTNDNSGPCANGVGAEVAKAKGKWDEDACMKTQTDKINKQAASDASSGQWNKIQKSVNPKQIYPYAANGNDYMAIWSLGVGTFGDSEERGVSIATWKGLTETQPSEAIMVTKAEFYYSVSDPCGDPGQSWSTKGSSIFCGTGLKSFGLPFWGDIMDSSLWNPQWTVRLRRMSYPMIPIGEMASSSLDSVLQKVAKDYLKGLAKGSSSSAQNSVTIGSNFISFFTHFVELGGGTADGAIAGELEKAYGYEH